eukprot:7149373-Karenia_brevis.AAC.1
MLDGTCDTACPDAIDEVLSCIDASKWDWGSYKLPNLSDICNSINCARDNTPGFDGIPNAARKIVTLARVFIP